MSVKGRTAFFPSKIDNVTDGQVNLAHEHQKIHEGWHFIYTAVISASEGDDDWNYIIVPPASRKCHMTFQINSSRYLNIDLQENVTYTDGLTETFVNNDRNSANVAGTIMKTGATVTGAGTSIFVAKLGENGSVEIIPVECKTVRPDEEFILKTGYNYRLRISTETSEAGGANISLRINIYEHTAVE